MAEPISINSVELTSALSLLVVDDSEDDYMICKYRLQKVAENSFIFTWAESAEKAKELIEKESFDCIICDYQMPGEDGLSFLKWLRSQDSITPLVFFTGQGNEQLAARALKTGAHDYFTKNHEFAQFERLANSIFSATEINKRNRLLQNIETIITHIDHESLYLTGIKYLQKVTMLLCKELKLDHAFIATVEEQKDLLNLVVFVSDGEFQEDHDVPLQGTPCEDVLSNMFKSVDSNVRELYPGKALLEELNVEGYIGITLFNSEGEVIGLLSLLHSSPITHTNVIRSLITSLSSRLGAEIERSRFIEEMKIQTEFLNSILDDQTEAIVRYNPDGTRQFANIAYCQLFGLDRSTILKTNVFDDLPEDAENALRRRISSLTPADPVKKTIRILSKKGKRGRTIEWTDRALFSSTGELVEIQSVGHDISDLMAAKAKNQELESHFETLYDLAGDAIFTMKAERFVDCNRKAEQMFGFNRNEMSKITPAHISPELQADGKSSVEKMMHYINLAKDKTVHFNWIHLDREGNPFDAQVTLSRFQRNGQDFTLAIVRNLTELKESLQ